VFALTPQRSIAVNESVTLLYDAAFQPGVLPAGTAMRVEALVSFGNAGARGGSGATGSNIDVNGNGGVDADEANVRTVPSRVTLAALPTTPEETNASVSLTDEVTTSGTVTYTNLADGVPATSSASGQWSVLSEIVGAANLALGGSGLPAGYTYSSLSDLLDNVNAHCFDDCKVGAFAVAHLSRTPCP
jgi:hypothetical protein